MRKDNYGDDKMREDINKTIMQYFEWYLPENCELWKKVASEASYLDSIGITGVWLPPAYKGEGGNKDTGYGVYDLYDLGEFDQKGSIATKYGTKDEYINAIKVLKGNNLQVYADIVLNHRMGADGTEEVMAIEEQANNRNVEINKPSLIQAWTKYTFDARNNLILNGIGHIFMVLIGTSYKKEKVYLSFMVNTGMQM